MYPILFSFGKVIIYSHGVMVSLGMILGGLVLYRLAKLEKLKTGFILELLIYSIVGGLLGARALYLILYANQFTGWKQMLEIWNGGMVSFGGMAIALIVAYFYLKNKKQNIFHWFDLGIIAMAVGWAIGRIGCFLNGDSTGIPTPSILGIWGRYPTALFETVLLLAISIFCFWLYQRIKNIWPSGLIFCLAIGLYGLGRFFIDFVQDEPIWFWHLRYGQIGSLILIILALIFFLKIKSGTSKKIIG
jgi:phosphatidylglycerol:prolipoprotein diacylglycerol transferase